MRYLKEDELVYIPRRAQWGKVIEIDEDILNDSNEMYYWVQEVETGLESLYQREKLITHEEISGDEIKLEDTGTKFDNDKPRFSLVNVDFLESLIRVLELGAKKYGEYNWQKLDVERIENAAMRHLLEILKGNEVDQESGEPHASHLAANAMFLHYFYQERK